MRGVRGVGGVRCAGLRCSTRRLMSTANRENRDDVSKEIKVVLSVPQSFKRFYDGSSKWWERGRAAYKQATAEYWKTWIINPYCGKIAIACVAAGALVGGYIGGHADVNWVIGTDRRQKRKNENIVSGMGYGSVAGACVAITGPYAIWLPVAYVFYSTAFRVINLITPKPNIDK